MKKEKPASSGGGNALSLVAIVISLSALAVSVLEVTSLKGQQRASVWPYVEASLSYSGDGFKLSLENKGIGPALLGDVILTYEGKEIPSTDDLDQIIVDVIGDERAFSFDTYMATDAAGDVLAPGDESVLFGVPWTPETRAFVEAAGQSLSMKGCFCSVYDDCWRIVPDAAPEPVRRCQRG